MAFDFIDLIINNADEYLTGYYYDRRPVSQDDGRITFNYRQLDPNSKVFSTVLSNLRADRATYAIATNDFDGFKVGGYVCTQNGLIWEITEVISNEEAKGQNDSLRWFKTARGAEWSVRMIQVTDLIAVRESYTTECEIELTFNKQIKTANITSGVMYNIEVNVLKIYVDKGTEVEVTITFEDDMDYHLNISKEQTQRQSYIATITV
jgi:hypothetical protein